jgi:hypothetical protein
MEAVSAPLLPVHHADMPSVDHAVVTAA